MKTPKCVNCGEKMLETYTRQGLLVYLCLHAQMTKLDISHGAIYCSNLNVSTHVEETKASFEYARNRYPKAVTSAANVRALRASFADLTKNTRPTAYNTQLKQAWEQSPQKGVSALIIATIQDHPHLEEAFSQELIDKSKQDLKEKE